MNYSKFMKKNFFFKIKIFFNSRKVFKNWYIFSNVYFGIEKKSHVTFETKNNLKLKIRTKSTDLMALTNVWLIQEYVHNDFQIKKNDVIIDIGAHIGLFSLFASQYCKNGKIFSFEPIKENFELLMDNINSNSIKNIHAFNLAVNKEGNKVKIFCKQDDSAHSIFGEDTKTVFANAISLKRIFDDNKIEQCDFLKIDCEGAEYDIIDSLPIEYFTKINKMIIEYHFADSKYELSKKLISKIKDVGFIVETTPHYDDMGFLYARRI